MVTFYLKMYEFYINKLRKLITKGSKYRKSLTICWDKAISSGVSRVF